MKNKKGQALVEFIIIMPIMIYVIMGFCDLIIIASNRSNLDSKMNEVSSKYNEKNNEQIKEYLNKDLKNVEFKIAKDEKYTYLQAKINYKFITPGFNKFFKDFEIRSERVIMNEP